MQRAEVLKAAGEAVVDRGLNYGQPEDNFANIARMWNAHLVNRELLKYPAGIEPFDVALMMANVKQVRIACDPNHADSWIDFTGYGACGGEVARCGVTDNEFKIGEVVNLKEYAPGDDPGVVSAINRDTIVVRWTSGLRGSFKASDLRRGP